MISTNAATQGSVVATAPAPSIAAPTLGTQKTWLDVAHVVTLGIQLGLLVLVVERFNIESPAFLHLSILAFTGALIHGLLPFEHRLPFFAVLSLTGIFVVFGAVQGLWLIALSLALIVICHLPLRFGTRVALLVGSGLALVAMRSEWVRVPWSRAIWPILGSMFMFRLIVYMYDLRHETGPRSVWRTLSYFFLLPNVCFPLFPVVDYKTFRRTYYNEEARRIQQVGVQWIFRGILHLLLYRVVYYFLTMSAADVTSPTDLGRFMVANYLLYLRISGQFHIIVGMLRLFGFNLPETHHRYLFASSINDFWRRINIYWKDFMMKLFYYPSFFALRKRGVTERAALVLATLVVFLSTWLLHSYQWFWLRGSFPITWPDGLFWGVLGVLVVGNTLYESSKNRARRLTRRLSAVEFGGVALRTALTFCFICVLWSLWTAESVTQWLALWPSAFGNGVSAQTWEALFIGAVAAVIGSGLGGNSGQSKLPAQPSVPRRTWLMQLRARPGLVTTAAILALLVMGHPPVYSHLDVRLAGVLASLREQKLNRQDVAMLEKGYYENLLSVERFNSQLWELYSRRPADHDRTLRGMGMVRPVDGFLLEDLAPSRRVTFRGQTFSTNRFGMRDQDYQEDKPPGTWRVAILGASDLMGFGVADGQTFEALLEHRLNEEFGLVEVLNFGGSAYTPLHYAHLVTTRVAAFKPDTVVMVAHPDDSLRSVTHVVELLGAGRELPYNTLRDIANGAGFRPGSTEGEISLRLTPHARALTAWAYHAFAEATRNIGAEPIWIFVPFLVEKNERADPELLQLASEAGLKMIDLSDVYRGRILSDFRIHESDLHHPNAAGHALIADRLYEDLTTHGLAKRMPPSTDRSSVTSPTHGNQ